MIAIRDDIRVVGVLADEVGALKLFNVPPHVAKNPPCREI